MVVVLKFLDQHLATLSVETSLAMAVLKIKFFFCFFGTRAWAWISYTIQATIGAKSSLTMMDLNNNLNLGPT